jgi:hypothetical protein
VIVLLDDLTDRRDGKPKQALEVAGGIMHAHTVYRDPRVAALSDEELRALDTITQKLVQPAQDDPQNQIESKPAIEVTDTPQGTTLVP